MCFGSDWSPVLCMGVPYLQPWDGGRLGGPVVTRHLCLLQQDPGGCLIVVTDIGRRGVTPCVTIIIIIIIIA